MQSVGNAYLSLHGQVEAAEAKRITACSTAAEVNPGHSGLQFQHCTPAGIRGQSSNLAAAAAQTSSDLTHIAVHIPQSSPLNKTGPDCGDVYWQDS